jgi:hypothetical protein
LNQTESHADSSNIAKQTDASKLNKSNSQSKNNPDDVCTNKILFSIVYNFNSTSNNSFSRFLLMHIKDCDYYEDSSNAVNSDSYETGLTKSTDLSSSSSTTDKYNNPNVLKRIYALKYLQRSTDINSLSSREFWMPDDQVKECFECNDKFTTFRRRHVIDIFLSCLFPMISDKFEFFCSCWLYVFVYSIVVYVAKFFVTSVRITKYRLNWYNRIKQVIGFGWCTVNVWIV